MTENLHEAAIREWIIRQVRARGHKRSDATPFTRDHVRNVRYGIDEGFHGSDVTPPDDPTVALTYELRAYDRQIGHWSDKDGWMEQHETIEYITPAEFVQQCLAIYHELAGGS